MQALPTLSLSASVPHHAYETGRRGDKGSSSESGPGDMTITGAWGPRVGDEGVEGRWDARTLFFIAGLRLPTGDSDLDQFEGVSGEVVPLGSGTTDALLGAAYRAEMAAGFRAFDILIFSIPLNENDEEPPPGTYLGTKDAFSVSNRFGVGFMPDPSVDLYVALDVLWKDRASGTAVSRDDGGTFFWLTPGATVAVGGGFSLEGSVQISLGNGNTTGMLGLLFQF